MRYCLVFVLLLSAAIAAQAETSASALARLLTEKGVLTRDDLARVEAASADDAVRLLTSLLADRGVITTVEASRISGGNSPAPAGEARVVQAVYQPPTTPAPQTIRDAPAAGPASAAPPVVAASKIPITVYGTVLVNAFFNSAATNNQDIPLVLGKQGADALGNDKSFGMTARQSRFGIRLAAGQVAGGKLSGNFEFDLLGGKAPFPNAVSFDILRVRHAYARVDWDHWSVLGGQDWSVFAPVNPASYASYAIPLFAASGNPWIRTPQLRVEYKNTNVLFQVAATDPNVGDEPTTAVVGLRQPLAGERGRLPAADMRIASLGKIGGRDASLGFSGHYGRGKNSGTLANGTVRQVPFDSWGAAFDYTLPLAKKLNLVGELYTGRALGVYSVSLAESYLPVGTAGERGVLSRGGWVQAQFFATPKVQFNLGYGQDDSDTNTLRVGDRYKNQSYDGSIYYKLSPAVTFAWEYRRMLSDYRNQIFANERGDVASMGMAFTF